MSPKGPDRARRLRFILAGSSARKLKRGGANLLAGRAVTRRLHPLTIRELGDDFDLARALRLGTLPAVVTHGEEEARDLLRSYGETYLREEIQAEAVVRNLGSFGRFLDVAAAQCGEILNYTAVGRDAALATRTVQEYFQVWRTRSSASGSRRGRKARAQGWSNTRASISSTPESRTRPRTA